METLNSMVPWSIAPALLIALGCQIWVQTTLGRASPLRTRLSGYAVARQLLDGSGLYEVMVEQVPGHGGAHYDVRRRVLQLSPDVYHGRSLAALGIAAHETGHALQSAAGGVPLAVREVAVPAASFGSGAGILLAIVGLLIQFPPFLTWGVLLFSAVVLVELVNVPIELDASVRARDLLTRIGVVTVDESAPLRRVMRAAAMTYVGATLQSILTLMQYASAAIQRRRGDD